jgi:hypothetical protein
VQNFAKFRIAKFRIHPTSYLMKTFRWNIAFHFSMDGDVVAQLGDVVAQLGDVVAQLGDVVAQLLGMWWLSCWGCGGSVG